MIITQDRAASCRCSPFPRHPLRPIIHLFLHLGIDFSLDGMQPTLDLCLCRGKERIAMMIVGSLHLTIITGGSSAVRFATINVPRMSLVGTVHGRWHLRHEFHVEFVALNHILWTMEANQIRTSTAIPHFRQGDPKLRRKATYKSIRSKRKFVRACI
jgi:hypothetical protein